MFGTGVYFAEGMLDNHDKSQRRRADLAKAFEEFKKNNPYATAADYQAWIDMHAGGDNYLRAGLPGNEVLGRLEQDGQERRRRDTVKAQLEEMHERGRTQGMVDSVIDNLILNSGVDDPDELYRQAVKLLGGPEMANSLNLSKAITPERVNRVLGDRMLQLVPKAVELMGHTDADMTARDLAVALGIKEDLAERVRLTAQGRIQRERTENWWRNISSWRQTARDLAADGANLDIITEKLAASSGMRPEDVRGIADGAFQEAQRTRRTAEWEMQGKLVQRVQQDPTTVAMIRSNDTAGAKRRIMEQIERAAFNFGNPEEAVNSIYEDLVAFINQGIETQHLERKDAVNERLRTATSEAANASRQYAENVAGRSLQEKYMGRNRGDPSVLNAVYALASRYDMRDPGTMAGVERWLAANASNIPSDANAIASAIENSEDFRALARRIGDSAAAQQDVIRAENMPPMFFQDYMQSIEGSITSAAATMERDFQRAFVEDVMGSWSEFTPQELERKILGARMYLRTTLEEQKRQLDAHREHSIRWLKTGNDSVYNPQAVERAFSVLRDKAALLEAQIDEAERNLEERKREQAARAPDGGASAPGGAAGARRTSSAIVHEQQNTEGTALHDRLIEQMRTGRETSAQGFQDNDMQTLLDFIENGGVLSSGARLTREDVEAMTPRERMIEAQRVRLQSPRTPR